jgi:hypothetical protein
MSDKTKRADFETALESVRDELAGRDDAPVGAESFGGAVKGLWTVITQFLADPVNRDALWRAWQAWERAHGGGGGTQPAPAPPPPPEPAS